MSGIEVQHSGFQLVKSKVENAFSSTTIQFDSNETSANYSNNFKYELKPNFEIYSIRKDSPADRVGLKVGDIIIKLNNYQSHNLTIQKIIELFHDKPGKPIKIVINRNGEIKTFTFQLEKII